MCRSSTSLRVVCFSYGGFNFSMLLLTHTVICVFVHCICSLPKLADSLAHFSSKQTPMLHRGGDVYQSKHFQCRTLFNLSQNKIPSTIYCWTLKCRHCLSWVFLILCFLFRLICWVDCSCSCRMEYNCRLRLQMAKGVPEAAAICSPRLSIWGASKGQEDQWKGN